MQRNDGASPSILNLKAPAAVPGRARRARNVPS